ncbi:MAG TPA: LysR family transcriptional regulator [Paraburkholderia sp.]|jgi:LysR family carnitine catabolism transcriptional activator|nr:LysR family transcriptional regulator [Paraburkholderia sp.]
MKPNVRQIEAFVEVARLGSFSRAAERLHLSQAGLSILVRKLESTLGVQLFERTTRNVVLTAAGQEILTAAERIVSDVAALADTARGVSRRIARRVALALPPRLAATRLPLALSRFTPQFPEVEISFRECINAEMVALVSAGEVDFGLGFDIAPRSDIVRASIGTDRLVAVCAESHPLSRRRTLQWRDVARERIITPPHSSAARTLIERQFAACGTVLAAIYEANSLVAIEMARHELGIAIVSAGGNEHAGGTGIVQKTLQKPCVSRTLMCVTRRGLVLPEAANALIAQFAAVSGTR